MSRRQCQLLNLETFGAKNMTDFDKMARSWMLNEEIGAANIQTHIQALEEVLGNIYFRTNSNKNRVATAKNHLREIKRYARRLKERVTTLEEQVSVLEEATITGKQDLTGDD